MVRVIFGVGNKDVEYDDFDLVQVQLMANDVQKVIAHRRAEEALRASEKRYREMLELLPVTVFEADATGRVVSYNPAAVQMFGLKMDDTDKGMNMFDFVSEKDRDDVYAHFSGFMQGKQPKPTEYEALKGDGSAFPAMVFSHPMKRGEDIMGVRGVVVDLSEIKAAQEALRLSEKKYRDIYENATEGIFQSTPDGHILSANRALARMNGYETPEALIADTRDIARQLYVNREKRQAMVNLMAKQGLLTDFEFQVYRRGGEKIWVSMNAHAVRNEAGEIAYYEGTMTDITQRKDAEEQLKQAYLVLQETNEKLIQADKLAAVGTLAAGVAHEILNPLNIIAMGIAALQSTESLTEPVREAFNIFQRQIDRIVRIARDLQQFSRKSAIKMEPTHLRQVIDDTLALCEPRFKIENIGLAVDYDDTIPQITIDRGRIGQVFLNIINNALDAMAACEKKELRIAVKTIAKTGIDLGRVLVAFSDAGHGIKENDLDHLFDPFFTTKQPGKGTGLGLSISYTIVQNHGGRIWAENNPDGGATFFVELPLQGYADSEA